MDRRAESRASSPALANVLTCHLERNEAPAQDLICHLERSEAPAQDLICHLERSEAPAERSRKTPLRFRSDA